MQRSQVEVCNQNVRLLRVILNAVFPSVGQSKIDEMVDTKAKQVAEEERTGAPEEEKKPLFKEAVDLQLKDLQFLKQNSENLKA
ncbi:hypothetical protein QJS10_CPB14g00152 [Acorus calamus]|uniref:Uncharacterized protein n=1 Tax=Acorus calamus TaxID=4465 RepID=A0AAV9DCC1_ACOCL|nr:hypothetical protein QJS10_CPB14g00152 [Acorus calamus]